MVEQARHLRDAVAAEHQESVAEPLLADRIEQRTRTFAWQLSHREVASAVIGLNLAVSQASNAIGLILAERLKVPGCQPEPETEPGQDRMAAEAADEEAEEEIAVEDPKAPETDDVTTMMQQELRTKTKLDALWKPISTEDMKKLEEGVLEMLPDQTNPEPSLTILAQLGTRPPGCGSLLRWLHTSPMSCVPKIIKVLLGIPGMPHPDQTAARRLQDAAQNQAVPDTLEALLNHWRDTSDVAILQEKGVRAETRAPSKQKGASNGASRKLQKAWAQLQDGTED